MNSGEIGHEDACALALFLARTNPQAITLVEGAVVDTRER
jgi:hypothetical protein